jgi:hypothetical protein
MCRASRLPLSEAVLVLAVAFGTFAGLASPTRNDSAEYSASSRSAWKRSWSQIASVIERDYEHEHRRNHAGQLRTWRHVVWREDAARSRA